MAAARRTVAGLDTYIPPAAAESLLLLVSELVTNAIRHGGADEARALGLDMSVSSRTVRVEVRDPGDGFATGSPRTADGEGEAEGGWGLVLLEKLADRWGIQREPQHVVWFEIDRRESPDGEEEAL